MPAKTPPCSESKNLQVTLKNSIDELLPNCDAFGADIIHATLLSMRFLDRSFHDLSLCVLSCYVENNLRSAPWQRLHIDQVSAG
jgi:hypothetical protein